MEEQIMEQCRCGGEIYVKELGHRTSNILQVAMFALGRGLQARPELLSQAVDQLRGAADLNRMLAGQTAGIAGLGAHLMQVCAATGRSVGTGEEIELQLDVPTLIVDMEDARCLGMIVSELVANSIKHAFPEGRGAISIAVRDDGDHTFIMVEDDGHCAGWSRPGGRGREIVDGLARRMNGRVRRVLTPAGSSRIQVMTRSVAIVAGPPAGSS